ncbi:MAG: ABC transporter ATP-binding protein [Methylophilaceae bacterium]|nr:ABC transporter ATP-binding protein [Methylophilaceae bacterium]
MEFKLIKELWIHISNQRKKQFYFLFVLIFLGSLSEFISIGLLIPFITAISNPEIIFDNKYAYPLITYLNITSNHDLLISMVVLFASAAFISGILRVMLIRNISKLSYMTGADLNINIYKRTLSQNYEAHIGADKSEVINKIINKTRLIVTGVIYPLLTILSSFIIGSVILALLIFVSPVTTILVVSFIGLIYILIIKFTRVNLSQKSEVIAKNSSKLVLFIQESLGNIRDIIIDNAHTKFYQKFSDIDYPLQKSESDILFIGQSPKYLMESAGMILIAIIAFFLAKESQNFDQALPVLAVMALSAQKLLPLVQQIYYGFSSVRGVGKSLEDVLIILRMPINDYGKKHNLKKFLFSKNIELKNITYRYPNESEDALSKINLKINYGDCIGIIGDSGCGKSTLLDIIMGLLSPSSGEFYVDGTKLNKQTLKTWQSNIAHVPQSIFLTNESIEKNIVFLDEEVDIDNELLRKVINDSQLGEFLFKLSSQSRATIGDMGEKLSGGQRQRVGLARAMYKKPAVFILDEATSALDKKTEEKIVESIFKSYKGSTVIMVAHRLTSLKNCNKIFKFENNKLVNIGSYKENFNDN